MEREIDVLTICNNGGCSGDGISGRDSFSISGMYGDPADHYDRVKEDGYVVDHRPVKDIVRAVIRAPLLDLKLKPSEIDGFTQDLVSDSLFAQAVMSDPSNGFGQLLHHEQADSKKRLDRKFSSLDKVGVDLYLEYWRDLGARIGQVVDGIVRWE